ncbi:MAG: hypothetical protein O7B24_06370 [Alphaproteobacteria bacterium]|nr:hypothetical protein [Alphaproteobacteria bacterium]
MHSRTTLVIAILVLGLVQTVFVLVTQNPGLDGQLIGPDGYMRLRRVMNLYETGNWYDAFDLRTNAPFGEQLHWTRLLDSILFAGAWVGSAVAEFPRALQAWGVIVGPATLLLLVPVWSWGTRSLLSPTGFVLSLAVLVLLPVLNAVFLLGRPDHHGLLALSFISMLAIFVRLAVGLSQERGALVAGVIAGVALWISVEALVAATFFGTALALLWVWRGDSYGRYISFYSVSLLATVTLSLAIERPPDQWLSPFYERISVVHWFLVGSLAATWFSVNAISRRLPIAPGRWRRIALLVTVGLLTMLAVALVFPKFFQGPLVDFRSPVFNEWLRNNTGARPAWPTDRSSLGMFLANLGPAFIALSYIGFYWKSASAERRSVFAILLLGYAIYLPLALYQARWSSYVQVLTLLPLVMALVGVWQWKGAIVFAGRAVPLRSLLATVIATGPLIAAVFVAGTGNASTQDFAIRLNHGCDRRAISEYLSQTHKGGAADDILLTYIFWGSELVWRTPYSVVGAPYGNTRSLGDTEILFNAPSDTAAADVIRHRGIDLILICTDYFENRKYATGGSTFFNRLTERPPAWLSPVGLPEHLVPTFRLYRVQAEKLPR